VCEREREKERVSDDHATVDVLDQDLKDNRREGIEIWETSLRKREREGGGKREREKEEGGEGERERERRGRGRETFLIKTWN
jgi:hypothetical protein